MEHCHLTFDHWELLFIVLFLPLRGLFSNLWNLCTSLVCISLCFFFSGASGEKNIYYSELAGRCDGLGHVQYAATLQNGLEGTARLQGQTSFFPLISRVKKWFLVSGQKKRRGDGGREGNRESSCFLSLKSVSQTEMPRLVTDLVANILISWNHSAISSVSKSCIQFAEKDAL